MQVLSSIQVHQWCVLVWAACKQAIAWLSILVTVLNGKGWYFSTQASTHPVSKDRQQAHFLSLYVAKIQLKNSALLETFSVAARNQRSAT